MRFFFFFVSPVVSCQAGGLDSFARSMTFRLSVRVMNHISSARQRGLGVRFVICFTTSVGRPTTAFEGVVCRFARSEAFQTTHAGNERLVWRHAFFASFGFASQLAMLGDAVTSCWHVLILPFGKQFFFFFLTRSNRIYSFATFAVPHLGAI
jgi:hypothetical protein